VTPQSASASAPRKWGSNKEVLDAVRGKVKSKLAGMSRDFVDSLDL
jgi:hypothetical protein